ncbi:unnamed protein product [Tetraodon nigroviridis]|uniref:Putative E3 ubiquitin-protein ligase UBR7 n=1 Tax=Tetraodon nigroviridis TaxID=99883 RepID=Q4RM14_TETNG|nr:unnamed protein product [Tetraodon nigroviridis]
MAAHKNNADSAETVDAADLQAAVCVLAGSDPENCSYSRGYVKRQAVFACNTCTPSAAEPAGICLACANECHDGHDIFELYTKRNFRCDCGNKKFGDFKCQLSPTKDAENVRNKYNHNFTGRYCTCDRPYPDQEDQVNDEMIQCVICEDWFHSKHLGCDLEEPEELQEMVCEGCMDRASFLWTYAAHLAVPTLSQVAVIQRAALRKGHAGEKAGLSEPVTSVWLCCSESLRGCRGAVSDGPVGHGSGLRAKRRGRAAGAAPADGADRLDGPRAAAGGHLRALATSVTGILDQCAAEGKAVTVEALCQFMDEVQASKRPRTDPE